MTTTNTVRLVTQPQARRQGLFSKIIRRPKTVVSGAILLFLLLVAIFAPMIAPYGPDELVGAPYVPPGGEFLIGTDEIGRDVFTRLLYGGRTSFSVGIFGALFAICLGVLLGSMAGYFGGKVDTVIMRIAEFFQILPALITALVASTLFGGSLYLVIGVIAVSFWPDSARVMRSQFLTLKERNYVELAKVAGFRSSKIIVREILPNALPPVIVQAALSVGWAILVEAGLSFIGVGDVNTPSWGQMISGGQSALAFSPYLSIFPGVLVAVVVLCCNFIGDDLNRVLDPHPPIRRVIVNGGKQQKPSVPANEAAPLITVQGLNCELQAGSRALDVIKNVSFTVGHGECVGIVGESGSGKSTVARVLAGLLPAVSRVTLSGQAWVEDLNLLESTEVYRRTDSKQAGVAMVFQDPMSHLNPTMRIGEQIAEALDRSLSKSEKSAKVQELLGKVDLPLDRKLERRYPHQLSGGQRQRAMIALALATEPKVLLADEPTTALDAHIQVQIVKTLLKLNREENLAILLISHDFALIANMCERVYVMRSGEFIEQGSVQDIFNRPQQPYTQELLASVPGIDNAEAGE